MFITPSKEAYLEALAAYDDDYLYSNSVCGRLSRLSAAVKILFVTTTLWFSLFTDRCSSNNPPTVSSIILRG